MMEVAEGAEARARGHKDPEPAPGKAEGAGDGKRGPPLSGSSYWLDLWLFLLFNAVLFVVFYLLP